MPFNTPMLRTPLLIIALLINIAGVVAVVLTWPRHGSTVIAAGACESSYQSACTSTDAASCSAENRIRQDEAERAVLRCLCNDEPRDAETIRAFYANHFIVSFLTGQSVPEDLGVICSEAAGA